MKERFEGEKNFKALVETLREQRIVAGNSNAAEEIAKLGQLDATSPTPRDNGTAAP